MILILLAVGNLSQANCKKIKVDGLTYIDLPIALTTQRGAVINSLLCHKSMTEPLTKAMQCVIIVGLEAELTTTGGCFCYRNVAGTDRLSRHANGTAIDLNPGLPMSPGIVDCFEQSGFEWGGRWSNPDPMHFELKEIK